MTLVIERSFTRRGENGGTISNVRMELDFKMMTIDGVEVPDSSVEYLMTFALQSLQDAYAGAKTLDEAKSFFAKKYEKLLAGSIGVRESGTAVSDETRIGRKLMRAQIKSDKALWAKFVQLSEEDQIATLDKNVSKNIKTLQPQIDAELEEIARKKAEAASLSKAISIEL